MRVLLDDYTVTSFLKHRCQANELDLQFFGDFVTGLSGTGLGLPTMCGICESTKYVSREKMVTIR